MAWNWMTSHTLNNVWEVFCMKIKGVDLKDITIRPLPLKILWCEVCRAVKIHKIRKSAQPEKLKNCRCKKRERHPV